MPSGNQAHIIHKQVLDIQVENKEEVKEWQERFSDYYKNEVLPFLEKACDDLVENDRHIRIDKLEIDLGTINGADLQSGLTEKLIKKFREQVIHMSYRHLKLVPGTFNDQQTVPAGVIESSTKSTSEIDLVAYYIKSGILPWWHSADKIELQDKIDTLLKDDFERLTQVILRLSRTKPFCLRIVNFFSEEQLVQLTDPAGKTDLKKLYRELKKIYGSRDVKPVFFGTIMRELLPVQPDEGVTNWQINLVERMFVQLDHPGSEIDITELKTKAGKILPEDALIIQLLEKREEQSDGSDWKVSARQNQESERFPDDLFQPPEVPEDLISPIPDKILKENEDDESIYTDFAGAVILWPYLEMFFREFGLIKEHIFRNEKSRGRAVQLLSYLVNGDKDVEEYQWPMLKLLCGVPIRDFVSTTFKLSDIEQKESEKLLKSVVRNWSVLKNTSPEGLQNSFLNRPGLLKQDTNGWRVFIERNSIDILLDRLSWPLSVVRLPWNDYIIHVKW